MMPYTELQIINELESLFPDVAFGSAIERKLAQIQQVFQESVLNGHISYTDIVRRLQHIHPFSNLIEEASEYIESITEADLTRSGFLVSVMNKIAEDYTKLFAQGMSVQPELFAPPHGTSWGTKFFEHIREQACQRRRNETDREWQDRSLKSGCQYDADTQTFHWQGFPIFHSVHKNVYKGFKYYIRRTFFLIGLGYLLDPTSQEYYTKGNTYIESTFCLNADYKIIAEKTIKKGLDDDANTLIYSHVMYILEGKNTYQVSDIMIPTSRLCNAIKGRLYHPADEEVPLIKDRIQELSLTTPIKNYDSSGQTTKETHLDMLEDNDLAIEDIIIDAVHMNIFVRLFKIYFCAYSLFIEEIERNYPNIKSQYRLLKPYKFQGVHNNNSELFRLVQELYPDTCHTRFSHAMQDIFNLRAEAKPPHSFYNTAAICFHLIFGFSSHKDLEKAFREIGLDPFVDALYALLYHENPSAENRVFDIYCDQRQYDKTNQKVFDNFVTEIKKSMEHFCTIIE